MPYFGRCHFAFGLFNSIASRLSYICKNTFLLVRILLNDDIMFYFFNRSSGFILEGKNPVFRTRFPSHFRLFLYQSLYSPLNSFFFFPTLPMYLPSCFSWWSLIGDSECFVVVHQFLNCFQARDGKQCEKTFRIKHSLLGVFLL